MRDTAKCEEVGDKCIPKKQQKPRRPGIFQPNNSDDSSHTDDSSDTDDSSHTDDDQPLPMMRTFERGDGKKLTLR